MSAPETTNPQKSLEDFRLRVISEQNLLAWIRTGLSLMGFGFVVARFHWFMRQFSLESSTHVLQKKTAASQSGSIGLTVWIGLGLIILGVCINLLAGREHARFLDCLQKNLEYHPPRRSMGITVTILLAIIGILMASHLLYLEIDTP